MLRKHQKELIKLVNEKVEQIRREGRKHLIESEVADIVANVFPGGGKSTYPIIAFDILKKAGLVDKLCWVVPRLSLQFQGASGFLDEYFKTLYPHNYNIRETEKSNDINPTHGCDGYITTYQSISTAYKSSKSKHKESNHEIDFRKHRYLLFLDECQHATSNNLKKKTNLEDEDSFGFYQSILPLFQLSNFTLAASGTLERHEKTEKVAFVKYNSITNVFGDIEYAPQTDLNYTRKDALTDKAIIKLYASPGLLDNLSYKKGEEEFKKNKFETKMDLSVALDTGYGMQLLRNGIKHWQNYKLTRNSRSKIIVVGHSQKHCREIVQELKMMGLNDCCLAISDEKKDGQKAIRNFRKQNNCNILVTCQMAYEGLDCKEATHLIALTKIRSRPWLIQMLTRVMRIDLKNKLLWENQRCYVFAPDDDIMNKIIKELGAEKIPNVEELKELPVLEIPDLDKEPVKLDLVTDASSNLSHNYIYDLNGDKLSPEVFEKITLFQAKYNINQSEIDTFNMLKSMNALHQLNEFTTSEEVEPEDEILTLREKETILRNEIETLARKLDYRFKCKYGTWNKRSHNAFRYKKRRDMNVEELIEVKKWLLSTSKKEAEIINQTHN